MSDYLIKEVRPEKENIMQTFIFIFLILVATNCHAGLIKPVTSQTQTELTTEQKQHMTTNEIQTIANTEYRSAVMNFQRVYSLVWENKYGLTPQEVVDGLPLPDRVELFQIAVIKANYLNALNNFIPEGKRIVFPTEAPKSVTIGQDGTVTIGE